MFHKDRRLDDDDRAFLTENMAGLTEHLDTLGARVTLLSIADFEEFIKTKDADWEGVEDDLDNIDKTLKRELTLVTLLALDAKEQDYFEPKEPLFGADVATKFIASAESEIDEAGKCLALGRTTAAVFHLMRVMEIAVRAVARCLGVPDPTKPAEKNWGFVLGEIRKGIEAKWPTVAARSTGDGATFEALYASLDAVKNPWRNPTMHPANKYTNYEAEHIFTAVKGFMMRLASRCDEDGEPKA